MCRHNVLIPSNHGKKIGRKIYSVVKQFKVKLKDSPIRIVVHYKLWLQIQKKNSILNDKTISNISLYDGQNRSCFSFSPYATKLIAHIFHPKDREFEK